MTKQRTAPPETINIRSAIPSTSNPLIMRFIKPLVVSFAAKRLVKAKFDKLRAEQDVKDDAFSIEPIEGLESDEVQVRDHSWWFGTPIVDELIIAYDDYTNDQGNSVPAGGIVLQNILLTVNQPKIIERTRVPGHRGRIKQFISDDDFEIQAVGKVIAPPEDFSGTYTLNGGATIKPRGAFKQGNRPVDEIMALIRVLKAQIEVDVNSPFLNLFDITRCVIGPYSFPQEPGRLDNQYIKFTMWSDEEFDVTTGAVL